jgi:hypothetical protein
MYLTDKKNGVDRELDDHEELEVLLESFCKQVEEIVNEAENIEVTCRISPYWMSSCNISCYRAMSNLHKRSLS